MFHALVAKGTSSVFEIKEKLEGKKFLSVRLVSMVNMTTVFYMNVPINSFY